MRDIQEKSEHSFFPPPNRDPESETGWQVSFMDIITLLLTTLIISLAVNHTHFLSPISDYFRSTGDTEYIFTPIEEIKSVLEHQLESDIDQDRISIVRELNDLRITFNSRRLYRPGEATLLPEARPLLDKVLSALQATYQYNYNIDVEGHTDNNPIVESSYPSNWELSTARAANVVKYLSDLNFDEKRLKASGYAYSRPLVPNEDSFGNPLPENMERNRRIVLRVYQDEGQLKVNEKSPESDFSINGWDRSNCYFSLQIGGYQSLNNAMRAAKNAASNTGLDFSLTYNSNLFSVQTSDDIRLPQMIELHPKVSEQLDNNQVSIIHKCGQSSQWLQYQVQFGSFQQRENALRFIADLKSQYNIDSVISTVGEIHQVVSEPFNNHQAAQTSLDELKQFEQLSDSFIVYDKETVGDYRFDYQLQIDSFRSESDANQFLNIVSELDLSPVVQELEMQNGSLYVVVEKSSRDWDGLQRLKREIEIYTDKQTIIHLIEISGS